MFNISHHIYSTLVAAVLLSFSCSSLAIQITATSEFDSNEYALFGGGSDTATNGTVISGITEQDGGMSGLMQGNDAGIFVGHNITKSWIGDSFGASGQHNTFSSLSSFIWEDTVTNTSGSNQSYFYTLNIDKGFLAVIENSNPADNTTSVYARYNIDVLLNNTSVWNSSVEVNLGNSGTDQLQGGTDFGGSFGNFAVCALAPDGSTCEDIGSDPDIGGQMGYGYQWNIFSDTINLGSFADGESFTLSYLASVETGGSNSFEDGSSGLVAVGVLGDPGALTSLPGNVLATVPLPPAVWLFASGFAGFLGMLFRKSSKSKR